MKRKKYIYFSTLHPISTDDNNFIQELDNYLINEFNSPYYYSYSIIPSPELHCFIASNKRMKTILKILFDSKLITNLVIIKVSEYSFALTYPLHKELNNWLEKNVSSPINKDPLHTKIGSELNKKSSIGN